MKILYSLILFPTFMIAQVAQFNQLDINNVKANIIPNADFIGNLNGSGLPYQAPQNGNIPSISKAALWIGGFVNGNLRTAAMTYRQSGQDFWPGPLDTANLAIDQTTSTAWDKSWRVNVFEIDSFITNYNNGNVGNGSYIIPQNIATWPGNGNVSQNQANQLAPFIDSNNDCIYNPINGDYPKIKGDQAIWYVFNDMLGNHTESGSVNPMGLEIHAMAYFCPTIADSEKVINNATFYEFKIFNRSSNIIDSTNIGIWVDADLGYWNDDYVGCDVQNNFAYIYNGDNFDQNKFGVNGYGNNHAFQAIQILKGPTADTDDGIDNDKDGCVDCTFQIDPLTCSASISLTPIVDEITTEENKLSHFKPLLNSPDVYNGNPSSTGNGIQFYNLINGYWKNGAAMYNDGLEGKSANGLKCNHIYPGTSDPIGYSLGGTVQAPVDMSSWSEVTAANTPGDRKLLLSMGKFTFIPQTSKTLEFAIITSRLDNTSGNNLDFTNMNTDTRKVREWYTCGNFPSCVGNSNFISEPVQESGHSLPFPNPSEDEITITFIDNTGLLKEVRVTNTFGTEVMYEQSYGNSLTLNINHLANGMYLAKITEGQNLRTILFVKN